MPTDLTRLTARATALAALVIAPLMAALAAGLPDPVRNRLREVGHGDGGYSTEAVVVIALLVAMAIAAVAIISAKVLAKAHGLSLG